VLRFMSDTAIPPTCNQANVTTLPDRNVRHRRCLEYVQAGALQSRIISGSGASALEAFSDLDLDDGLAGDPQPAGFPVKRFDHP
jgi:hypothetical protein